jgi:hypothetical protein
MLSNVNLHSGANLGGVESFNGHLYYFRKVLIKSIIRKSSPGGRGNWLNTFFENLPQTLFKGIVKTEKRGVDTGHRSKFELPQHRTQSLMFLGRFKGFLFFKSKKISFSMER